MGPTFININISNIYQRVRVLLIHYQAQRKPLYTSQIAHPHSLNTPAYPHRLKHTRTPTLPKKHPHIPDVQWRGGAMSAKCEALCYFSQNNDAIPFLCYISNDKALLIVISHWSKRSKSTDCKNQGPTKKGG